VRRTRRPRRLLRATVAVLGAAALLAGAGGGAVAAEESPPSSWGLAWAEPMSTGGLHPGGTETGRLRLHNDGDLPIEVQLAVVDLVDDENGCLPAERLSVVEDCGESGGAGTGELSDQLVVTLTAPDGDLHDGPLLDLTEARTPAVTVAADGEVLVDVVVALPAASTNETMTDVVSFSWQSYAGGEQSAVLGASAEARPGQLSTPGATQSGVLGSVAEVVGSVAGVLPATGSTVGLALLATACALVSTGVVLWRRGRRQPVEPPTP
jgi:LPXTG-motif cell wall-anchored protein